jgi:hypothetical protein
MLGEASILSDQSAALARRHEFLVVFFVLVLISLGFWWRFLPMPHQDLDFFTEPGYLLANYGKLADPGGQHYDLAYQRGVYNYPPGYFLILAAWIKAFGLSPDSLLGYTHTIHVVFLLGLWALLRFRYSCSKVVSSLVLLSVFPFFHHGRPDLTGALWGVIAWLALPDGPDVGRLILSGCCTGATMLVSPAFGVGTLSTLAVLMMVDSRVSLCLRCRSLVIWLASAGLLFAAVVAIVLSSQHSWVTAYVEFTTNIAIRGREVNSWPHMLTFFAAAFSIIPFALIALVPACYIALTMWRDRPSALRNVTLAFLGGTIAWLASNKAQLLLEYHFMFPAKSVFLGVFSSWPKLPSRVRLVPLVLLALIGWYYQKADFLYLMSPLREEAHVHAKSVDFANDTSEVAVDSLYFAQLYRPWHTLDYETLDLTYWSVYASAIPPRFRGELLSGLPETPAAPSIMAASALTMMRLHLLNEDVDVRGFECARPPEIFDHLRLLGHTWNLPAHPYAMMVCTSSAQGIAVHSENRLANSLRDLPLATQTHYFLHNLPEGTGGNGLGQ